MAAGADDLFLFRRVGGSRFAHLGGVGRGVGWAGIVELGLEEEPLVADSLLSGAVVRHEGEEPKHVFGPYYARVSAVVPVDADMFAVFGSSNDHLLNRSDGELRQLAGSVGSSISEVAAAKRLADELEVVNAVRDLLGSSAGSFEEATQSLVTHAATALSCEVGVLYVPGRETIAVFDPNDQLQSSAEEILVAMAEIASDDNLPLCIQDSSERELPSPFSTTNGTVAYYLLGVREPQRAVLLLAHTSAAPRGFTLLCQSLGLRLVEAAGPLLATALSRDDLRSDLFRAAEQARQDALTEVANRLAWDEAFDNFVPTGGPASIIQVDCRGLKQANERHGHHVGDKLLRRTAVLIQGATRHGDLVARVGGDEFAVLLYDADEDIAQRVVERIQAAIDSEPALESITLGVTIGVATTTTADLAEAHRTADGRMLANKRATLNA